VRGSIRLAAQCRCVPVNSDVRTHMDAALALFHLVWAPVLAGAISCVYFVRWDSGTALERVALSAHGALLGWLLVLAWLVGATGAARQSFATPFALAFLVPTALAVAALFRFQGNKVVHLLQLPLLACGFWIWFVGTMAITGEWL
jgi:hypothetical protein